MPSANILSRYIFIITSLKRRSAFIVLVRTNAMCNCFWTNAILTCFTTFSTAEVAVIRHVICSPTVEKRYSQLSASTTQTAMGLLLTKTAIWCCDADCFDSLLCQRLLCHSFDVFKASELFATTKLSTHSYGASFSLSAQVY